MRQKGMDTGEIRFPEPDHLSLRAGTSSVSSETNLGAGGIVEIDKGFASMKKSAAPSWAGNVILTAAAG
ncbi:MAG TPA: hypothetical protein VMW51_08055 [Terriglobia bacterium]|nr:hypothetical protein [Terriglobia bacterium]